MRALLIGMLLIAGPAMAADGEKLQMGTVFELQDGAVCIRQDIVQELLDTGSREKAANRLHEYYEVVANGEHVCRVVERERFRVTNVILRATLGGTPFEFVEVQDSAGKTWYTLVTDPAGSAT